MEVKETILWYVVEYSYIKKGSGKLQYKASRDFDTVEALETFSGVIHGLGHLNPKEMEQKHLDLAKRFLGPGKFPKEILAVYRYTKTRVK